MRKDVGRAYDLARLHSVIQADKSVISEACKTLILQDIADKCNEYFDLTGLPRLEVSCTNGTYYISVQFEAERIKKFNVIK